MGEITINIDFVKDHVLVESLVGVSCEWFDRKLLVYWNDAELNLLKKSGLVPHGSYHKDREQFIELSNSFIFTDSNDFDLIFNY